jgi:hypothetical protein
MPKVELGTFRVVAWEELKMEIKISRWGGAFCVFGVLCGAWGRGGGKARERALGSPTPTHPLAHRDA